MDQMEPQSEKDARYLLRRLKEKSPISRSELYQKTRRYREGKFSLDDTLELLKTRGDIEIKTMHDAKKPTMLIRLLE